MKKEELKELQRIATKIRMGIIEGVYNAKSGHPGGSLSAADIMAYLYFKKMNVNPENPKDEARDRFVLSKGHAAPVLYSASISITILPDCLELTTISPLTPLPNIM